MNIAFPFSIERGRIASCDQSAYVQQLIEQVLLTDPNERVNRPDFGSGIEMQVFQPALLNTAGTIQHGVEASLRANLAGLANIVAVTVEPEGATLALKIEYQLLDSGKTGHVTLRPKSMA